ncbi:hypothetical protein FSP39_012011 [Pinctada imbricata]|uniref:Uncharacterized protein n=1 Tax=Pinctada imbricata TaxID=66713 RepID=A0AA89BM53_PINIB|nr:hypothetical protein FSP39_012011 [Pinctada imbricata]
MKRLEERQLDLETVLKNEKKTNLYKEKLELIDSTVQSHGELIESLQKQGEIMDENLNITSREKSQLSRKLSQLSRKINEMDQNNTAAFLDQYGYWKETDNIVKTLSNYVDSLQTVSNKSVQKVKGIDEKIAMMESRLVKDNRRNHDITNRVEVLEELSAHLEQNVSEAFAEMEDRVVQDNKLIRNITNQVEVLEELSAHMEQNISRIFADMKDRMVKDNRIIHNITDRFEVLEGLSMQLEQNLSKIFAKFGNMDENMSGRFGNIEQANRNYTSFLDNLRREVETIQEQSKNQSSLLLDINSRICNDNGSSIRSSQLHELESLSGSSNSLQTRVARLEQNKNNMTSVIENLKEVTGT